MSPSMAQNEPLVLKLLELGADVDSNDEFELVSLTPLQAMCCRGPSVRVVEMAVARTRDLNQLDEDGRSLLHLATISSGMTATWKLAIIHAFIDAGIHVDVLTACEFRNTALMLAASYGSTEIVEALLSEGADTSIQDAYGWTALLVACHMGYLPIVKLLSAAKAGWQEVEIGLLVSLDPFQCLSISDVFQSLYGDRTFWAGPLQIVASSGNHELLRELLEWKQHGRNQLESPHGPISFVVVRVLWPYGMRPNLSGEKIRRQRC